MTMNGSARFHRRTVTQATAKKKTGKFQTVLISCCLFLAILCACLLASLVLIGKHLYLNKGDVLSKEENSGTALYKNMSFRLPTDAKPLHYDLTFKPNLQNGTFEGRINITLKILRPRRNIVLHNNNLTITNISLVFSNQSQLLTVISEETNKVLESTTVNVQEDILPGIYYLNINFAGNMLNKLVGLYRSIYTDKLTNTKRTIATSKFEPTYARQAFPCFDEPNMKAKFSVHIFRPATDGYIALSNMPEQSTTVLDNGVMVNFEESKEMSTYLSCFIVCDFKSNDDVITPSVGEPFPLRVFSTAAQVNKTLFALDVGKSVMEYFTSYFGIPYPLPKLDLIAIPDFVSGAMEHWGLVTFRETALLFDENTGSSRNKQRVATVVAHELAHSWFGNLVTMDWWNDLWLNEGFATYMQYKGTDYKFKDWQLLDQFLVETMHSVLSFDATPASHPIVQTVITPDQITEIFDSITYNKGCSVLRMLDHAITQDIFQKGIKNYLLKHQWGNAITQDLWDELQKLVPESINVTEIMNTWTMQMGYPIVTIDEDNNNYILTQKRFLKDYSKPGLLKSPFEYKWSIPITYVADGSLDPVTIWFNYDQPNLKIEKPKNTTWIKFNHNQVGYYRVNYKTDHWKLLAKHINEMSTSDKTHLLEESFSIAESGELSYTIPLELTKYLKDEFNSIPWNVAFSKLTLLDKYLVNTLYFANYKKYILTIVSPAYEKFTWDEKPHDTHLSKQARALILNLACGSGHKNCTRIAIEKFHSWLQNATENTIPQELKRTVYYYGIKHSTAENWFRVLEIFKKEVDASEKLNLMYGLTASKESWLLHYLLEVAALEGQEQVIRSQDYFTLLQEIAENPIGTPIVWNYVRENWNYLVKRFTTNDRYLGRLIPAITKTFTATTQLKEMKAFFEEYPNAGAGQISRQEALANVNNNIGWIKKNRDDVIMWLKKQDL